MKILFIFLMLGVFSIKDRFGQALSVNPSVFHNSAECHLFLNTAGQDNSVEPVLIILISNL